MGIAARQSYSLGLCFILSVSIFWSASSVLVQYLDITYQFESPFFVTYLGVSLFALLLPLGCIYYPWAQQTNHATLFTLAPTTEEEVEEEVEYPTTTHEQDAPLSSPFLTHKQHMALAAKIAPCWFLANYFYNKSLVLTSITSSTILASTGSVFTFLFATIFAKTEIGTRRKFLGVVLAFLGSCWTSLVDFNQDTTITTTSSSASASSPFSSSIWGDVTGLIAAMGYGMYTVLLSSLCPKDESTMSMNLLLGYMGLFQMIFWSPWLLLSDFNATNGMQSRFLIVQQEANHKTNLTWPIFSCLILKGLVDNVLSDYLWARAVLMTSATVATVGLGLTIPLAFVSDALLAPLIMDKDQTNSTSTSGGVQPVDVRSNIHHIVGAVLVLIGFVLVNIGHDQHAGMSMEHNNALESEEMEGESCVTR